MITLSTRLRRIQRALVAQIFLVRLADLALAGALVWIAWAVARFALGAAIWDSELVATLVVGEILAAAIWAWSARPDLSQTAAGIDRLANTRDRFTTALALENPGSEIEHRAAAECSQFVDRFDERPWTRLRPSPRFFALLAPAILTALLIWFAQPSPPTAPEIAQRENANTRAEALATLAKKIEETPTPDAKKLAAEMKQAVEKIKAAPTAAEADKASLRALSELSAALRNQALATQQAALDALARALAGQPATSAAAKDLQDRNLSAAAEKLQQASQNLDAETERKLAEAMKKALAQLGEQSGSEMAQQMGELAESQSAASAALQKLAQMLQQQAGNRPSNLSQSSANSRAMTEQEMQNMLENLRNNPQGASREIVSMGQGSKGQQPGPGSGKIAQSDFSKPGGNSSADDAPPSGQPGSEHDQGTTKTPFGAKSALKDPTETTQLSGVLGQGESLQSLVQAAGGDGSAARRYRDLYNAMAPAAEQTVDQENIPAGSRYLIKRYFESIRPAE